MTFFRSCGTINQTKLTYDNSKGPAVWTKEERATSARSSTKLATIKTSIDNFIAAYDFTYAATDPGAKPPFDNIIKSIDANMNEIVRLLTNLIKKYQSESIKQLDNIYKPNLITTMKGGVLPDYVEAYIRQRCQLYINLYNSLIDSDIDLVRQEIASEETQLKKFEKELKDISCFYLDLVG